MKRSIKTAFILFLLSACVNRSKNFTEKIVVVGNKESVKVEEINMTISNGGWGRKWLTNNGGERPYCDLTVKIKDSIYHFGDSFEPLYINNLQLIIDKMNP